MRTVHVEPPSELGTREVLAYALFLPEDAGAGGVVMLHGAGSQKENQFDVARALRATGVAAGCFDQRGHGESDGAHVAGVVAICPATAELLARGLRTGRFSFRADHDAMYALLTAADEAAAAAAL